jgi:hypothetical protein
METDVTDIVQRYRLALRYIWNSCIWVDPNLRTWDSVYSFRDLKLPLFRSLVADPLDMNAVDSIFGKGFEVVPDMEVGVGLPLIEVDSRVPSQPEKYGGIWIPLQGPFKADDIRMTLIDLFDWMPLAYSDLRYYVVLIQAFQEHPEKVGQHALVDVNWVRVLWTGSDEAPI